MEATTTNQADLQPAINASNIAQPQNVVTPVPDSSEMAGGGDVAPETKNDGSLDTSQTIAIVLIGLTLVSIVLNIVVQRRQLMKLDKDDSTLWRRLDEVTFNVKQVRGDKYEPLSA
jgi:hypothetical protein